MNYILLDFEWNRALDKCGIISDPIDFETEIIEIGAIKLNEKLVFLDDFQTFVNPKFYPVMNGEVASLTKIRTSILQRAPLFLDAYRSFKEWCGEDSCLCTWGDRDVQVLFDNAIMHNLEVPDNLLWCDLQKIFSIEIMREPEGRKWSLEKAIDFLGLSKYRAHDALNDVKNTLAICNRVNLLDYCNDYATCFVNYRNDRIRGFVSGKEYYLLSEMQNDPEVMNLICPCCSDMVVFEELIRVEGKGLFGYGQCGCGNDYLAHIRRKRRMNGSFKASRIVMKMNDVLWDEYQDALEANRGGLALAG